ILLDEPFTGIDPKSVAEIQEVVRYLRARGLGVIVTDHNVRETLAITDRSTIIYDGSELFSGTAGEIMESPEARRFYLGERFQM
ncbi:MAG: LPS export ABC transporter ATP-binding protein, partial [Gemmatimonadales bacterium]